MEIECMLEGAKLVDELNATNSSKLDNETDSLYIRSIFLKSVEDSLTSMHFNDKTLLYLRV